MSPPGFEEESFTLLFQLTCSQLMSRIDVWVFERAVLPGASKCNSHNYIIVSYVSRRKLESTGMFDASHGEVTDVSEEGNASFFRI